MAINSPFHGLLGHLGLGVNTAKIAVNHVRSLCSPGTAITPGGFSTFATTLNSIIGIIHSTENKA